MAGAAGDIEAAFGADRSAEPLEWTWTDLTDRTQRQLRIRRGRASGGAADVAPGQMVVPLDNGDGALTPRNPASTYFPDVKRGLPVRASVHTGDRYLACPGSTGAYMSAPDSAGLSITGDFAAAIELECPLSVPLVGGVGWELAGKYRATGNQRSWHWRVTPDAAMNLVLSSDGSATVQATQELSFPRPDAGLFTLAFYVDVDNGASGHTVYWYWVRGGSIDDLVADPDAYLIGSTVGSGTLSIFDSTAALTVGDGTGTGNGTRGNVRAFRLFNGSLAGTEVANPDVTGQTVGASSFADSAGNTWTVSSPAEVTDRKVRLIGELAANRPRWPGQSAGGEQVEWEVAGLLRRLRQGDAPLKSALYRRVLANDDVYGYWPCEDARDATIVTSPLEGVVRGRLTGDMRPATDDTLDASEALPHASSGTYGFLFWVPESTPSTEWEVTWLVRIPTEPTTTTRLMTIQMVGGTLWRWYVTLSATTLSLIAQDFDDGVVLTDTISSDDRMFDTWSLLSLTVDQSGSDVLYDLDWIVLPDGFGFQIDGTLTSETLGRPRSLNVHPSVGTVPPDGISVGHFIVSSGKTPGWLAPADTAWSGEPAGRRFHRLCAEEGIQGLVDGPNSVLWGTAQEAGCRTMGPQRPAPLLDLLAECVAVEDGLMGESRELPGLTMRSGLSQFNQTPALTATPVGRLEADDDDQDLVNDLTVQRVEGSSSRQVADASVAALGRYEQSESANPATDLHVPDLAHWWLTRRSWPTMRYPQMLYELAKDGGSLIADWLNTQPGDLVRASNLPAEHHPSTVDQVLVGYTEDINPHQWTVAAVGVPPGPLQSVGERDNGDTARRDTAGSELASGVTDSATSLSVSVTAGPLWTTEAGDVPFDIDLGGDDDSAGERCTVTAVSGTSSPQTFTVTRSVNGVTRAWDAGARIRLWRPCIRAL